MKRIIDAIAFSEKLSQWRDDLRNANECGGCGADLLDRVIAVANNMSVACDLPNVQDAGQLANRED